MDEETYRSYIAGVFNNLTHKREMKDTTLQADGYNASCGDRLTLFMKVNADGFVTDMSFIGESCLLSQVSAQLMSEYTIGKSLHDIKKLTLTELEGIVGIRPSLSRIRCLELPLIALRNVLTSDLF